MGANQARHAEQAAHTGLQLALVLALICSATLAFFNQTLAALFSTDAAVVMGASAVLAWVAFYHLMDAMQVVSVFILRCYRMTFLPLVGPLYAGPTVEASWYRRSDLLLTSSF